MAHKNQGTRRQRLTEVKSSEISETEENSSLPTSVSLKSRRPSSNFPSPFQDNSKSDTEYESSDVKKLERPSTDVRLAKERIRDKEEEKDFEKRKRKRIRRSARRRENRSVGYNRTSGTSRSEDAKRRRKISSPRDEIPITEILKKAEKHVRTKYEEPVSLPELTTDTIYIQRRNGFSAIKAAEFRSSRRGFERDEMEKSKKNDLSVVVPGTYPSIRVAIAAQTFWKRSGLVYQGLLGGMAFMHFIVIHVLFHPSAEFIFHYTVISEIYTNVFSFLITMCVVSVLDKFDLARLSMDHLHDVYRHHTRTAISIPLYFTALCLHQISAKTEDRLTLIHYQSINESTWQNSTNLEVFLDDLKDWQVLTISKDILAVLAWLFVSLGTQEDMLLTHLKSMKRYTGEVGSTR